MNSYEEGLAYAQEIYGDFDMFPAKDGCTIIRNERVIASVGKRGGLIEHISIFDGRMIKNGAYSKK